MPPPVAVLGPAPVPLLPEERANLHLALVDAFITEDRLDALTLAALNLPVQPDDPVRRVGRDGAQRHPVLREPEQR